ncbi:MAG: hypothetical protein ACK5LN_08455 [Propioniciclava sp.]
MVARRWAPDGFPAEELGITGGGVNVGVASRKDFSDVRGLRVARAFGVVGSFWDSLLASWSTVGVADGEAGTAVIVWDDSRVDTAAIVAPASTATDIAAGASFLRTAASLGGCIRRKGCSGPAEYARRGAAAVDGSANGSHEPPATDALMR